METTERSNVDPIQMIEKMEAAQAMSIQYRLGKLLVTAIAGLIAGELAGKAYPLVIKAIQNRNTTA